MRRIAKNREIWQRYDTWSRPNNLNPVGSTAFVIIKFRFPATVRLFVNLSLTPLILLVPVEGFEPPTY